MLSPSIYSVCNQLHNILDQDIKLSLQLNNRRKSLVLQMIRDGNTQSFINAIESAVEYKKVIHRSSSGDENNNNNKTINRCTDEQMRQLCYAKLNASPVDSSPTTTTTPPILTRNMIDIIGKDIGQDINYPSIDTSNGDGLRIMSWNICSEALAINYDRFETLPEDQLRWSSRIWKIVLEIVNYSTIDVICMQEVDCFDYLISILSQLGYGGIFVPKPDSPCNYMANNSGPDGCAIFWRTDRLDLIKYSKRILRVYSYKTNQVVLTATFKHRLSGRYVCIANTHLKARRGPILSAYRNEQGKDLLKYLLKKSKHMPLVVCGDFNAEPQEQVYRHLTSTTSSVLSSVYRQALGSEPAFTTWTKRQGERQLKKTLDYIFVRKDCFSVKSVLSVDSKLLTKPIPNPWYPSDHLSLVTELTFIDK